MCLIQQKSFIAKHYIDLAAILERVLLYVTILPHYNAYKKQTLVTLHECIAYCHDIEGEAQWPSGRVSDSGARGRGFNPHSGRRVVSLSNLHLPPKKSW